MKVALEHFFVRELNPTSALLGVVGQHSFVVFPEIIQQIEVCIIEACVQLDWVVIVDFTVPVKLVMRPVPLVGKLPSFVV